MILAAAEALFGFTVLTAAQVLCGAISFAFSVPRAVFVAALQSLGAAIHAARVAIAAQATLARLAGGLHDHLGAQLIAYTQLILRAFQLAGSAGFLEALPAVAGLIGGAGLQLQAQPVIAATGHRVALTIDLSWGARCVYA